LPLYNGPQMNLLDGAIGHGRHTMKIRVFYEDTDFSQRVYHASYLRFMERGRTNYLRLLGANHRELFEETEEETPGFAFVVRRMNIEFLRPAHIDDVLDVITMPEKVKGASITLHQQVVRNGETLVEAHVQVAFVSGGRARPIPKPLRIAMNADKAQWEPEELVTAPTSGK
jgi:acyl-CoA thioester hydrolase